MSIHSPIGGSHSYSDENLEKNSSLIFSLFIFDLMLQSARSLRANSPTWNERVSERKDNQNQPALFDSIYAGFGAQETPWRETVGGLSEGVNVTSAVYIYRKMDLQLCKSIEERLMDVFKDPPLPIPKHQSLSYLVVVPLSLIHSLRPRVQPWLQKFWWDQLQFGQQSGRHTMCYLSSACVWLQDWWDYRSGWVVGLEGCWVDRL